MEPTRQPGYLLDDLSPALPTLAISVLAGLFLLTLYDAQLDRVAPEIALRNGGLLALALIVTFAARLMRPAAPAARSDLEPAFEAVPYGLARWSDTGRLIAANPAFQSLLRLEDRCAKRGISYAAVSKSLAGRIEALPVLDESRQRVVEIEREDGTTLLLDERPLPEGGFVTIVTDITQRKSADRMLAAIREEQHTLAQKYHEEKIRAEAASRAKTAFLAHLSHDIRTPLNHIIGFTDLIGMETYGPLGDARYNTYLRDIRQAGERLLKRFSDILEFAELEGGHRVLKCEPVPLDDLVANTAARFSGRATRAGVHLDVQTHACGYLAGDRQSLGRMLDNVVDNAIRYTPRGGEIRLAVWSADDGVVLEISDTGKGMAEDQLSALTQPFAVSDAGCARHHDGVGLGIAISRAIAEASGGRLVIDSQLESGTTVAISLPAAQGLPAVWDVTQAQAA
ncbi:PAS domain-containing sensor histidine kinase [Pelagibacterium limicola]|uniref:sensor histidine kinase n=1 Tax=Pelagibacterium limicola TaxID=2791022 RepID=UPI0018AFFB32|nr:PAS domain-containing sensor histidine kinase [Pelagibacterium limicola]